MMIWAFTPSVFNHDGISHINIFIHLYILTIFNYDNVSVVVGDGM